MASPSAIVRSNRGRKGKTQLRHFEDSGDGKAAQILDFLTATENVVQKRVLAIGARSGKELDDRRFGVVSCPTPRDRWGPAKSRDLADLSRPAGQSQPLISMSICGA